MLHNEGSLEKEENSHLWTIWKDNMGFLKLQDENNMEEQVLELHTEQ